MAKSTSKVQEWWRSGRLCRKVLGSFLISIPFLLISSPSLHFYLVGFPEVSRRCLVSLSSHLCGSLCCNFLSPNFWWFLLSLQELSQESRSFPSLCASLVSATRVSPVEALLTLFCHCKLNAPLSVSSLRARSVTYLSLSPPAMWCLAHSRNPINADRRSDGE